MVDTIVGTMSYKGNLAREHQKAHLYLKPKIRLHLHHLGVSVHLEVSLCLEVHHLLMKVLLPFLVVLLSHE
jgi:hypothetical protein